MVDDDVITNPIGSNLIATLAGANLIFTVSVGPFLCLLGVLALQLSSEDLQRHLAVLDLGSTINPHGEAGWSMDRQHTRIRGISMLPTGA
jgi:hypothetical protein